MWRQFGGLGNDGAVYIADGIAFGAYPTRHFAQQCRRVRAFELCVGVREMAANIAQRGRTQQGISNGVQQSIGVRMPQQSFVVPDIHATQNQFAAFDQGMNVPAFTNADCVHQFSFGVSLLRLANTACASAKSCG